MRNWLRGVMIALASATATAGIFLLLEPVTAQTQGSTYQAPRFPGSQQPDLGGIWQSLNTANWDVLDHGAAPGPYPAMLGAWGAQPPGQSIVDGGELPYKPEALEKKKANYANRLKIDPFNIHDSGDPEAKCYAPGVPRAMYMPYPFQILQMPDKILMVFGYSNVSRFIQLTDHQPAPLDLWMGWSNGKWEGDTLVVDVTGFNGHSWLDRSGNFTSGTLHVVERYTPTGPNTIMYEATIEDPDVFTKPWKMTFPLYRRLEKNAQILDFRCVTITEEFLYGSLAKKGSFTKKGS
jgi:hypothetical protein